MDTFERIARISIDKFVLFAHSWNLRQEYSYKIVKVISTLQGRIALGARKVYIWQRLMLCYHLRFRGRKASARIIIEMRDMMGRSLPTIYVDGDGRSFRLTLVLIFRLIPIGSEILSIPYSTVCFNSRSSIKPCESKGFFGSLGGLLSNTWITCP